MVFTKDHYKLLYYTFDEPTVVNYLCFDPLCSHDVNDVYWGEDCVASHHVYGGELSQAGIIVADGYDRPDSPVLYLAYRMTDVATVNGQTVEREPTYCVERFDIAAGTRVKLVQGIQNEITQLVTYGDYVYFAADDTLYSLQKRDGKIVKETSLEQVKVVGMMGEQILLLGYGDKLYTYQVDAEKSDPVLCCSLEDLSVSGDPGVFQKISNDFLYFTANYEYDYTDTDPEDDLLPSQHCDLYRLPLSDQTAQPELVVEDVNSPGLYTMFADNVFYYQPFDYETYRTNMDTKPEETDPYTSDGVIVAVDLKTLEKTTVYDNPKMNIYLKWAYDDRVIFVEPSGDWYFIASSNGESAKTWCERNKHCYYQPIEYIFAEEYWDEIKNGRLGDKYVMPDE